MSRIRVLLAEDNENHQRLLALALTRGRPHVKVDVVETGRALLQRLGDPERLAYDCILLDFNLPDIRADGLLQRMKEERWDWPTLVVSSSRAQEVVIESMRGGSVDFVPKSEAVCGDTLWRRVELALARRQRFIENRRRIARRQRTLARQAESDPLTGLSNRRSLERLFRSRRAPFDRRRQLAVVLIDIDRFKQINDTYGHLQGDRVLAAVSTAIRARVQVADVACRWGGEEFVIIRRAGALGNTLTWAETLREAVAAMDVAVNGQRLAITVSMGVANCPSSRLSPQMITRADQAMYLAKRRGRNRVCTWEMVVFEQTAGQSRQRCSESPEACWRTMLARCAPRLGPTQRDHLTTHSEYVSHMAVRIGRALGLEAECVERLRIGGLFHDLGKFLIPEEVLARPGALSPEEHVLLARHAEEGAEMSRLLGADEETAGYVRYHHTDFGDRIGRKEHPVPLGARVLAVADAFVAMTSERAYRCGRSFTAAFGELRRAAGSQFDPEVVNALPRALRSDVPVSVA